MKQILLIYNPVAGKNQNRMSTINKIISLFSNNYVVVIYQTSMEDSMIPVLKEYTPKSDFICCCGGDGTLHRVVNDMLSSDIQMVPVAYIPNGSTNDYARTIGITKKNVLQKVLMNSVKKIDVGRFNDKYFNYVAAFGAFTKVSYETSQGKKNIFGYLAYVLEGMKELNDLQGIGATIKFADRVIEDEFIIGMIFNSTSIAGIKRKKIDIESLADGEMEYLFIKKPSSLIEIQTIIALLAKEKSDNRYLYYGKTSRIEIISEKLDWTLDGEAGGQYSSVEISVLKQKLNIITGY